MIHTMIDMKTRPPNLGGIMSSSPTKPAPSKELQVSLAFFHELLAGYSPRDFAIKFWDGSVWGAEAGQPTRFSLILQHPGSARKMFWPPSNSALAEAYIYNDFDVLGDIHAFFRLVTYLTELPWTPEQRMKLAWRLVFGMPMQERVAGGRQAAELSGSVHSPERDQQAIRYHYDVSNDFYRLWLDSAMVYSCAYFARPDEDLDAAQARKLDYICRKLRLRPGERLLDIGCGWGGLVLHAAQHYGVQALGITLSQKQLDLARQRIDQAAERLPGVQDKCRVELCDYRELAEPDASFDKLVSVGMFEHVGEAMLPAYFKQAFRLLRPSGVFLNHGIARNFHFQVPKDNFIKRYVFPDGELVPISTTLRVAEETNFELRDLESLREHYELTLRHWVRNLEQHADLARQATDDTTYRIWRLYLAASAHGFRTATYNLYQALLVKPDQGKAQLPLTRADWYS